MPLGELSSLFLLNFSIPKYATHLVYMTNASRTDEIEEKVEEKVEESSQDEAPLAEEMIVEEEA